MLALNSLLSDNYALRVGGSTAGIMRELIRNTLEFRELREALRTGSLTEIGAEKFINGILAGFVPGRHFPGEYALATLAVVLENYSSDFAEEYLRNLSDSPFVEFGIAPMVAKLCREQRKQQLTQPNVVRPQADVAPTEFIETRLYEMPILPQKTTGHHVTEITEIDEVRLEECETETKDCYAWCP